MTDLDEIERVAPPPIPQFTPRPPSTLCILPCCERLGLGLWQTRTGKPSKYNQPYSFWCPSFYSKHRAERVSLGTALGECACGWCSTPEAKP